MKAHDGPHFIRINMGKKTVFIRMVLNCAAWYLCKSEVFFVIHVT